MILSPILVIAILSSAFSDLMRSYEAAGDFAVGYRIETDSIFADNMGSVKEAGREAGITFLEYPEGEPKELIENNDLAGFVVFGDENYTIYETADFEAEGIVLEYFLNRVMRESVNQVLQAMAPASETEAVELPVETLDYMPAIDSADYYGIIYIVYFCWCGIVCAANVLNSEKKYGIQRKYQVTAISGLKMYLAKWIPTVLIVFAAMGITTIITILLLDINWGNALISACLVLLSVMASSAFGLMLYYISNNLAVTIIVLFTSVWFMGFVGGSFETYMFSNWSEWVKSLSPLYHTNRALVENACMGSSNYTGSSIIYLLLITVACSAVAVAADKVRRRGRA